MRIRTVAYGSVNAAPFAALWLFVFTIPWESTVTVPGIGTVSRIAGASALTVGSLAILVRGRVRPAPTSLIVIAGYTLIVVASLFWTLDSAATEQQAATGVQLFLMVLLIWNECTTESHVEALQIAYVLGAYVSIVATIIAFTSGLGSIDNRYMAPGFDPNELGVTVAVGIPIAWQLGVAAGRSRHAWVFRIYVPVALLAIILTASRGALLAAFAAVAAIPFSYKALRWRHKVAVALVLGLFLYKIDGIVPETTWQRLLTIPQQLEGGDLNLRTVIWAAGLDVFWEHPWLGIGAGAFPSVVGRRIGTDLVAHNTLVSVLVQEGLIGISLFLGLAMGLLYGVRAAVRDRYAYVLTFLTWFIGAMSLTWEQKKVTWFVFALLLLVGHSAGPRARAYRERKRLHMAASDGTTGVTLPAGTVL